MKREYLVHSEFGFPIHEEGVGIWLFFFYKKLTMSEEKNEKDLLYVIFFV